MKIALIQTKQNKLYDFENPGKYWSRREAHEKQREMIEQNIRLLEEARRLGADLAVTSEAVNFSGPPEFYLDDYAELIWDTQREYEEEFRKLAKQAQMAVITGMYRVEQNKKLYNSALFWNRQGELVGGYDKVHLAGSEKQYLSPGEDYRVFDTTFGKIGIGICWDMQFPECARAMALQGADLIVCPTWGWETVYGPARAYENGIYVAAAMAVPYRTEIQGLRSPSQIIGPEGKILCSGSVKEAEIVMGDVEIRDCKEFRRLRMSDRRSETYYILCQ